MHTSTRRILLLAALCSGVLLSACGGGGDSTATPIPGGAPVDGGYPAGTGDGSLEGAAEATPESVVPTAVSYP